MCAPCLRRKASAPVPWSPLCSGEREMELCLGEIKKKSTVTVGCVRIGVGNELAGEGRSRAGQCARQPNLQDQRKRGILVMGKLATMRHRKLPGPLSWEAGVQGLVRARADIKPPTPLKSQPRELWLVPFSSTVPDATPLISTNLRSVPLVP